MPKIKNKVQLPESKLLKAMAELESAIEKGDELEEQDPEGGLSTEGSPLSNAAPRGKADRAKKSRAATSSSSSASDDASSVSKAEDAESSMAKMLSASDTSDDASSEAPPKKKSKKKVAKAAGASTSSDDDDDSSSDVQSDDDDRPAEKSFRAQAEQDETMAKAIEVSSFLESMVDNIGVHTQRLTKALTKAFSEQLQAVESRLNARIDNRVAKSVALQQNYNTRAAQALSAIGNAIQDDVVDVMKSLANLPVSSPRGKAMLSKSEVNPPPFSGSRGGGGMADGSEGDFSELADLSTDAIGEWLFKKSATNQIDPKLILAWEADHYNVETLPLQVRKSLANDLCK
jgi:hypothetical protein